jgi:hypothetical protein
VPWNLATRCLRASLAVKRLLVPEMDDERIAMHGGCAVICGTRERRNGGCGVIWCWLHTYACALELGAGDAAAAVGGFFDVNKRYFDAAAALGRRLEGGDVDVVGDAEAEAVVIQPHVRDERVGGVGEAAPEACIEVNGVGLVVVGVDGPCAAEDDFARAGLVVEQAAEIDRAGGTGDGEEAPSVQGDAGRNVDRIDTQEGLLWMIEVIGGGPEIIVVVAVGGRVVEHAEVHIEIMYADEFGIDRFCGGAEPGAVELEAVFEGEAGAVEGFVGICALEADADLVVTVFIKAFVVGRGEREVVGIEDAAGGFVGHGHGADAPGVVLRQLAPEDGGVDGYRGGDECLVDVRPLIAVVAGYADHPVEFAGQGRVEGQGGGKELGKAGILGAGGGACQEEACA